MSTVATGSQISGVAVDASNDIFFGEFLNQRLQKVVAVGGVIPANPTVTTFATSVSYPLGMDFDSDGNLYLAKASQVAKLTAVGGLIPANPAIVPIVTGLNYANNVRVVGGDLIISDYGSGNSKLLSFAKASERITGIADATGDAPKFTAR